MSKKYYWYRIAVLAYYRAEWTDIPDQDHEYKIRLTANLDALIRNCWETDSNIPNSALEVKMFLDLEDTKINEKLI